MTIAEHARVGALSDAAQGLGEGERCVPHRRRLTPNAHHLRTCRVARVSLPLLLKRVRACTECAAELPLGPRPVVTWGKKPRLVIIGQAPGTKVHQSGIPWNDDSGDHLRSWLGLDQDTFYDSTQVALMPMGFCYPGRKGSGDAPPDPRCAPLWHSKLLSHADESALLLLVGQYAQAFYLGPRRRKSLTDTVRAFEDYLPRFFPLPHPSWRSKIWMKKNPWFSQKVLPGLRDEIAQKLG